MTLFFILLALLAVAAMTATVLHVVRDGYGRGKPKLPAAKDWSEIIR